MKRLRFAALVVLALLAACRGASARSDRSFDEIRDLVSDKSAAEVATLLGEPDTRQSVLIGDERWIWWNYTFLDGDEYPPELRGQIVHLEITFERPADPPPSEAADESEWWISGPLGVSYSLPART